MNKVLLGVLLSGLFASSAMAANVTGNFQSTATLNSTCKLTTQNIAFGQIDLVTTPGVITTAGSIDVLCSKGVNYTMSPNDSFGGTGSEYGIRMIGTNANKDLLIVKLYYGSTLWSQNISPANSISGTGTGLTQTQSLQAKIDPSVRAKGYLASATNEFNYQASPDIYTASVTVTVTY